MAHVYTRGGKAEEKAQRQKAGEYLKGLRQRVDGLTKKKLADQVGFGYYTMVSNIEKGLNRIPSEKLVAYARALKVNPNKFARRMLAMYYPEFHAAIFANHESNKDGRDHRVPETTED